MKATITIDGKLRVIPESELESYALERWWRDFNRGTNESALQVCIDGDTTTQEDSNA